MKIVIFHSYVSFPEGIFIKSKIFAHLHVYLTVLINKVKIFIFLSKAMICIKFPAFLGVSQVWKVWQKVRSLSALKPQIFGKLPESILANADAWHTVAGPHQRCLSRSLFLLKMGGFPPVVTCSTGGSKSKCALRNRKSLKSLKSWMILDDYG